MDIYRLKLSWDDQNPSKTYRSEINLCCQARAVISSHLLSELELMNIKQLVSASTSQSDTADENKSGDTPGRDTLVGTCRSHAMDLQSIPPASNLLTERVSVNCPAEFAVGSDADVAGKKFNTSLSCVHHCVNNVDPTSDLQIMFDRIILCLPKDKSDCFTARPAIPHFCKTKCVKHWLSVANECVSAVMQGL